MSRSKEVDPRDEVVASFPGAGIEMITVDVAFAITGQEPLIGFVLTRGGDLKPVTAEGVYDGDDVAIFLRPSGQVSWPHVETWPSFAAFSPDGVRIVTASEDKTARIWDAATGKEVAVLRGHEGAVLSAAFSPDGSQILTTSGGMHIFSRFLPMRCGMEPANSLREQRN
jgi:WD40 repeat protein